MKITSVLIFILSSVFISSLFSQNTQMNWDAYQSVSNLKQPTACNGCNLEDTDPLIIDNVKIFATVDQSFSYIIPKFDNQLVSRSDIQFFYIEMPLDVKIPLFLSNCSLII
jgi:hypothetical protein